LGPERKDFFVGYERGQFPADTVEKPSRFSWKAVVVALVAVALIVSPVVIIILTRGD
jgi:hypothetical protein